MREYKPEKVHRVILKISGEFLAGPKNFGFDFATIDRITDELLALKKYGVSVGVVLGGGNFFRGGIDSENLVSRVTGDNIGMLATVQNSLVLSDVLNKKNYSTEIFSSIQIDKVAKFYTPSDAENAFQDGKICFFCAGTGNPYFTTDTAAVLRAIELNADIVLKGTKVDGVYSADPAKDPNAEFITSVSYDEVLARRLNVMDMTAFSLARDNNMQIKVFNVTKPGMLKEAIFSKEFGTFIYS
jgi:uridylate kinase